MRNKGLYQELSQNTRCVLDLLLLASSLSNPGLGLGPSLVQGQQTALASSLDELIGLCNKLGTGLEEPGVGNLGLVQDVLNGSILREGQ